MLINFNDIKMYLHFNNITVTGVLHIGAHECEELPFYRHYLGVSESNMLWIDAYKFKVEQGKERGITNLYHALISNQDDIDTEFNIASNIQSSSILDFGTHTIEHPNIHFIDKVLLKTITINTFFKRNNIDPTKYNFWNLDIQGAELLALEGGENLLSNVDAIYIEVNIKQLYKNCPLISDIDTFLAKHNFKRELTKMTIHNWGDAIFLKHK